jgi:geranylgeranyl diphosphate synthase type II
MSRTVKQDLEIYRQDVEGFLQSCLRDESIPSALAGAMHYSLLAGGKRVRPVLCLVWAELFGLERQRVLPFASSLELIHTYSLVHDDLPAMDDDDYRRGMPSSHVRHGEAMAILSGDGLLTEAFAIMLASELPPDRIVRAAAEVTRAAGPRGMVGGQAIDMALTGGGVRDLESLKGMHAMKTGALITAACASGAILAGADDPGLDRARRFGGCVGLAFQVADDILDVVGDRDTMGKPVGSDAKQDKLTYPSLLGLEESRRWGRNLIAEAREALEPYSGPEAGFLSGLAQYVIDRAE